MSTATTNDQNTVEQFAKLLQRFVRMEAVNTTLTDEQADDWDVKDERTLLVASGLLAVAAQLERIADALTAPLPDQPLEIPVGGIDDDFITE